MKTTTNAAKRYALATDGGFAAAMACRSISGWNAMTPADRRARRASCVPEVLRLIRKRNGEAVEISATLALDLCRRDSFVLTMQVGESLSAGDACIFRIA